MAEDVYAGLEDAASAALSQEELLGRDFILSAYRQFESQFKDDDGNPRYNNIATVQFDGEEETVQAYLGGVVVNRQLAYLGNGGHLPLWLTLTRESGGNKPYILRPPEGGSVPQQEASEEPTVDPEATDEPKPKKDKVEFQRPTLADQQRFLALSGELRDRRGSEFVREMVKDVTAKCPKFMTINSEGKGKIQMAEIDVSTMDALLKRLEKEKGEAPMEEIEI